MQKPINIIEVRNVSKSFDTVKVLDNVDLLVRKGEFVTILGPSGCGKTTLLRIIAGFQTVSSGEVYMSGKNITDIPPHARPVNTVFQKYALFPHLNVYDNIAFGLKLKKMDGELIDREVTAALKMVSMSDYEDRDVDSLSGGQQQRVAIARAIINKPDVLLLDEPLSALDLKMRKDMQMELKQMHKELGITFIYVTHDQEEALTLSDTIVVMSDGKIQQIGTPHDIYNEPINPFVADFIGESNILNATMLEDCKVCFIDQEFTCVDKGFGKNMPVDVVIRPEDIYIFEENGSEMFSGVITSSIFKGVHYEMTLETDGGYEIVVQDYQHFEVGSRVGLRVKPFDIHVMEKERTCNSFDGVVVDQTHVKFLDNTFELATPTDLEAGREVIVEVDFDKVDLTDYKEDGVLIGNVTFILYKGNHYHLTITTDEKDNIYVDTQDIWDDGDSVGINFPSEAIRVVAK